MKTYLECLPCVINQAIRVVREFESDPERQIEIIRAAIKRLGEIPYDRPPSNNGMHIHKIIREQLKNPDPYKETKDYFNKLLLDRYDELKTMIKQSVNPFDTALRLSIAGNIIDFGGAHYGFDFDKTLNRVLDVPLTIDESKRLKTEIEKAHEIFYIGDNSGEIVMDRLFIEHMLESYGDKKITFVVRGGPIINDVTMREAELVGMTKIVRVIDSGIAAPGTVLEEAGKSFLDEFYKAPLIISKGQGNFETLCEERSRNLFFILMVKCEMVAHHIGVKVGDTVVKHVNT